MAYHAIDICFGTKASVGIKYSVIIIITNPIITSLYIAVVNIINMWDREKTSNGLLYVNGMIEIPHPYYPVSARPLACICNFTRFSGCFDFDMTEIDTFQAWTINVNGAFVVDNRTIWG